MWEPPDNCTRAGMSYSAAIRKRITDQIIEAIKGGTPPWRKPWSDLDTAGVPTNAVSKRRYSGINVLLLELEKQRRGFATNWWGTFNQWRAMGGSVRKRPDHVQPGQWGTKVVFFKPTVRKAKDEDGDECEIKYALLREFTVFNLDQVEGVPLSSFGVRPQLAFVDFAPADEVIAATKADIRYGGDRAFYSRSGDYIQMPQKTAFTCPAEFYATTFHELVHWSECRLAWKGNYAFGELVAEIGSCYLSSAVQIPQGSDMANHNAYVAHWLQELENDPAMVFRASSQASKAADLILSFKEGHEAETKDNAAATVAVLA